MSRKDIANLINFFEEILSREQAIVQIKKDIVEGRGHQIHAIFNRIALDDQIITIPVFEQYLKDRAACNSRQLYDIFQRFDHSRRGSISLCDFQKQMSQSKRCSKSYNKSSGLTHQIQSKFLTLLNIIIKTCRVADVWRKQLESAHPYELFRGINKSLTGVVGPSEILKFFYQNGKSCSQSKSRMLHRCLLKGQYRELTLQVFCENLKPLQFGQYASYGDKLQLYSKKDMVDKQMRVLEAQEAQRHYYKQLFNQKIKQQIHRQAVLTRQQELQKRIQQEIRTYNELKFITRQKYHPDLLPENMQVLQKQNIDQYNMRTREIENKARLNEETYRRRMNRADAVLAVQSFRSQQKDNRMLQKQVQNKYQQLTNQAELQKLIKKYTYNKINRKFKPQMNIQRDVLRQSYHI